MVAPTKSWTWMACTDSSGDFYYVRGGVTVSGASGEIAGPLYKIETPDTLTGYRSVSGLNTAGVTDATSILVDTSEAGVSGWQAGGNGVADIAALHADLSGAGSKQRYVVGIAHTGEVLMIRYSAPAKTYRLNSGSNPGFNFGSCWTYKDASASEHVYCARNDGGGIYEVMLGSVNLVARTVTLTKLGVSSAATGNNDGLNCLDAVLPFPTCGDKNGGGISPDPNPVTNAECGSGSHYLVAASSTACSAYLCVKFRGELCAS